MSSMYFKLIFSLLCAYSLSSVANPSLHPAERSLIAYAEEGNAAAIRQISNPGDLSTDVFIKALSIAISKGRRNTALAILSKAPHKADIELALLDACVHGRFHNALFLLEEGTDPEAFDTLGRTGLMLAAAGGHQELVRLLLTQEADINRKCNEGRTAYDYARIKKRTKVLEIKGLKPVKEGKPKAVQGRWQPDTVAGLASIAAVLVPVLTYYAYQRWVVSPRAGQAPKAQAAAVVAKTIVEPVVKALCAFCGESSERGNLLSEISCHHHLHTGCVRSIIANAMPEEFRAAALEAMTKSLQSAEIKHTLNSLVSAAMNGVSKALLKDPKIQEALFSISYNIFTPFLMRLQCPSCRTQFASANH